MPSLKQLHTQHVGKASDKWESYLTVYDTLFSDVRNMPVRILEIGIQNGGSLEIWSEFFKNASLILGCDIDPKCASLKYDNPKIKVIIGDANSKQTRSDIRAISDAFEIILDDGSHRSGDIIRTFSYHFANVAPSGFYVIEDLHCSYWENWAGGLQAPFSSMSFLKRLADVVNAQHWGDETDICQQLDFFAQHWDVDFKASQLDQIQSISFFNSICVIRKLANGRQTLGPRLVSGEKRLVFNDKSFRSGVEIETVKYDLDRAIFGKDAVAGRSPSMMGETNNKWGPKAASTENTVFTLGTLTERPTDFLEELKALRRPYSESLDFAEIISDISDLEARNTQFTNRIEELERSNKKLRQSFETLASNPLKGLLHWIAHFSTKIVSMTPFLSPSFREKMKRSSEKRDPLRFRRN